MESPQFPSNVKLARWVTGCFAALLVAPLSSMAADVDAPERPAARVQAILTAGDLARGEQVLITELKQEPGDDELRFGLGVVQFVHAVERVGQALHRYGVKAQHPSTPLFRLPVPVNPNPDAIGYAEFRELLDGFRRDLAVAELTLAEMEQAPVKLPLRLTRIQLDFDGDGDATDGLLAILRALMPRQPMQFLDTNPDFVVCFDRGDATWLQCYCHLLMGGLDLALAWNFEREFSAIAGTRFARPVPVRNPPDEAGVIDEPHRLDRLRRHLLQVIELNFETWEHIRAETDDDHEWLPNPVQRGVLGLEVSNERIDFWLKGMSQLKDALEGRRAFLKGLFKGGRGLNLQRLLEDPPECFPDGPDGIAEKYLSEAEDADALLQMWFQLLIDPLGVYYAAWFN